MTIGVGGLDGQGWEAELESASRQGVGEPWAGLQWPGSQRKGGDFFFPRPSGLTETGFLAQHFVGEVSMSCVPIGEGRRHVFPCVFRTCISREELG